MELSQKIPKHETTTDEPNGASGLLPIDTQSLCPECLRVIRATIYEADGRVFMRKRCLTHGAYQELLSSDATFYRLMLTRDRSAHATLPPAAATAPDCPRACGLCADHLSGPMMINIDLTNRCNLHCPICFANADARQEVAELNLDQIRRLLDLSCTTNAYRPPCLQYTGGEPTVHPEFLPALREAAARKFAQVQVATNGLRFAREPEFAAQAGEAGLNVAYLQFDGLRDEVYQRLRGRPLLELKRAAIANLYAAGVRTILVPTVVKGINDDQLGRILAFAVEHSAEVCAISWQPVAFTGRLDYAQRLAQRFTVADLVHEIERQTGLVEAYRDWYPFCFVDPFARLVEALDRAPTMALSCSPACGVATYLIVDSRTRRAAPLPSFIAVEPLMDTLRQTAARLQKGGLFGRMYATRELRGLHRFHDRKRGPANWSFEEFVDFLLDFVDFRERYGDNDARVKATENLRYRPLLMAGMHFQDVYNYQLDRVRRCVIHYAAADGRMYPFCSYNSGPCYRQRVESRLAVPLSRYQAAARPGTPGTLR
jgi:uncharacterized radical SAM superfamily Fe-S cluster-containing enzyme